MSIGFVDTKSRRYPVDRRWSRDLNNSIVGGMPPPPNPISTMWLESICESWWKFSLVVGDVKT